MLYMFIKQNFVNFHMETRLAAENRGFKGYKQVYQTWY